MQNIYSRSVLLSRSICTLATTRTYFTIKRPIRTGMPQGGPMPEFRKYARMENAQELFSKYRKDIIRSPMHHFVVVLEENPGLTVQQLWKKLVEATGDMYKNKNMMRKHLTQLRDCGYVMQQKNLLADKLPKGENGHTYMVTMKLKKMLIVKVLKYALEREKYLAEVAAAEQNK